MSASSRRPARASRPVTAGEELWAIIERKQGAALISDAIVGADDDDAVKEAGRALGWAEQVVDALRSFLTRRGGR